MIVTRPDAKLDRAAMLEVLGENTNDTIEELTELMRLIDGIPAETLEAGAAQYLITQVKVIRARQIEALNRCSRLAQQAGYTI